jgi:hypothetical protein
MAADNATEEQGPREIIASIAVLTNGCHPVKQDVVDAFNAWRLFAGASDKYSGKYFLNLKQSPCDAPFQVTYHHKYFGPGRQGARQQSAS